MMNPLQNVLTFQQALFHYTVSMNRIGAEMTMRLLEQNLRFLGHGWDDKRVVSKTPVSTGAALDDHYGKRNHDIDVEHDL